MLKAIFAKDVQAGDSVLLFGGERVDVAAIDSDAGEARSCIFVLTNGMRIVLDAYSIVGLGHRPRPEWKTDAYMREVVAAAARNVDAVVHGFTIQDHLSDPDAAIRALREVIEEYELGRESKG